ncbi:hypothetical protein [Pseudomonas crudilactis]|uniref:hypothetical protein n=1 Tax=Pseudomonas crudilactis TaxID=2697028 RepID=UPI0015D99A3E|nr:hypothetical protein [Pseudomonas crudilactis]
MSVFLSEFLPGFSATVLGIVLGFPVALYVNYRLTVFQNGQEKAREFRLRADLVGVIVRSLAYNETILGRMAELCAEEKAMRNPDLQLTTWEIIGHSFSSLCREPELLQLLSHHWLRLQKLDQMNREMFDRAVGVTAEFEGEGMASAIWGEFYVLSSSLQAHSRILLDRLAANGEE